MKKIFLGLIAIASIFAACETTTTLGPVTVSLSETAASGMFLSSDNNKMATVTIMNSSEGEAEITWERTAGDDPTGFTYMVNGAADMSGTISIAAGASVDVMLMVHPNGNTGLATGSIKFYDASDMTNTMQTFTYSFRSITEWFTATASGLLTDSDRATNTKDYIINVVNPNPDTVRVTWRKVETLPTTNWQIAICTDAVCWTPDIFSKEMAVAPNATVVFKSTIDPSGDLGTGGIDALFFMAADSSNTVEKLQISHTATN